MLGSVTIDVTLIAVSAKTFRIASYGTVQLPTNFLDILLMKWGYPAKLEKENGFGLLKFDFLKVQEIYLLSEVTFKV